jgi:pimeloyl-ACP methyl ester carboxylesterase
VAQWNGTGWLDLGGPGVVGALSDPRLAQSRGSMAVAFNRMLDRLQSLHQQYGRRVSLVGWSLGGVYARELSRRFPADVRQVITLASPFRDVEATNASTIHAQIAASHDGESASRVWNKPRSSCCGGPGSFRCKSSFSSVQSRSSGTCFLPKRCGPRLSLADAAFCGVT